MATDVIAPAGADEGGGGGGEKQRPPERADGAGGGFFHIHKKGQGYWTRMGTAGAALLIGLLTASFLYQHLPVWIGAAGVDQRAARSTSVYIITALLAGYGLLVFWLMNKPDNADFLIATDSEMKKVNWTTRKELIGSTKVVIIFMFLIALLLFVFDIVFGYLFYFLTVLKSRPF
ncbi:MAG TPA: preprotein translocase subunit SecE [Tepidisphaeraceae bacterium]|nr:preprotein translocase subunit SecE [Tepidisphaeraceae bacterium]